MMATRPLESSFTNCYGEEFVVRVDLTRETGEFLGDETDWEPIEIIDDRVPSYFILSREEWESMAKAWRELTGRELRKPLCLVVFEMAASPMGAS